MKASEVMHLYIGVYVKDIDKDYPLKLIGYNNGEDDELGIPLCLLINKRSDECYWTPLENNCRLQLRRESDMSEQEVKEYKKRKERVTTTEWNALTKRNCSGDTFYVDTPESIAYKLKIGVDCFGLLDNGEADYNPNVYKK